ncbi:MAG TPA: MGMT family protein [Solirubrobacteraceae bacterium]
MRTGHKGHEVERSVREARIAGIVDRIRHIPAGTVQTYGEIDPTAPRLVGRVLATSHQSLPWHRVIRADGSIPRGQPQRELLRNEGVPMRGERVDLAGLRSSFAGVRAIPRRRRAGSGHQSSPQPGTWRTPR